jgi:predicted transcriptional regulator
MPVKVGQRFVLRGSLAQIVLSYAVSEPGYWTVSGITEDIDRRKSNVLENVRSLKRRKLIATVEDQIYPTETGKVVLFKSMKVSVG